MHQHAPARPAPPSAAATARLTVGVVGVGRVGAVLAAALAHAGHRIVAASAGSAQSRARAASLLPSTPLLTCEQVAGEAGLVLLAVPDDALAPLVARLSAAVRPGTVVLHPSGRYGTDVLAPLVDVGAHALAVHPAMTFTGTPADLSRLSGAGMGVSTSDALMPVAETLVAQLGGHLVRVPAAARPLYHAALAHGANHLVTLVSEAADLLARAGVDDPAAVLRPLMTAALDNALRDGDAALTGPVARGDAGTVAAHADVIAAVDPAAADVYTALARRTTARAVAADRLAPAAAGAVLDALDGAARTGSTVGQGAAGRDGSEGAR